jgi:hypothetical protein
VAAKVANFLGNTPLSLAIDNKAYLGDAVEHGPTDSRGSH